VSGTVGVALSMTAIPGDEASRGFEKVGPMKRASNPTSFTCCALLAATLLTACAGSGEPADQACVGPRGLPDPDILACLQRPGPRVYMEALYRDVYAAWQTPPRSSGERVVPVRFELDPDGFVRFACVLQPRVDELAASALRALSDAQPFGTVRGEPACLVNREIIAEFRAASARGGETSR